MSALRVLALVISILGAGLGLWLYLNRQPEWPKPLDDFEITEAWLQCIDCQEGFFARLKGMPPGHKDSITRLLGDALLNGPDNAHKARFDQEIMKTWVADSLHRLARGETSTYQLNQYLARFRRGFDLTWRRRAAVALGAIRSDTALAALDTALAALGLALSQLPGSNAVDSVLYLAVERARADSVIFVP